MPLWLLVVLIFGGLLLIGAIIDWIAKRRKQRVLIERNNRDSHSFDEGYDPRNNDEYLT
ncbi:hypothetical protein ACFU8X_15250 [Brevibacillus porteri]|uniref:hypothetical protein n=1 Tax=Brevibacillus TaxID=55080 RepID=UPI001643A669|nr:hypothetical protein [Brevibacillus brevis]